MEEMCQGANEGAYMSHEVGREGVLNRVGRHKSERQKRVKEQDG